MRKNCALVATLLLLPFASLHSAPAPKNPIEENSSAYFQELMNDPMAKQIFKQMQLTGLNTAPDIYLNSLFDLYESSKPTAKLMKTLHAYHEAYLTRFEKRMSLNSIRITQDFLKGNALAKESAALARYRHLDNMTVATARDLGFSEEAIKNRQIFVLSGDVNAFTVSGNESRIIVGIQQGLLEKLQPAEVEAVLSHELGHVRSRHTLLGSTLNIMFSALAERFIANPGNMGEGAGEAHLIPGTPQICKTQKSVVENPAVSMKTEEHLALEQAYKQLFKENPKIRDSILAGFLDHLQKALAAAEAPKPTIEFFGKLEMLLGLGQEFRVDSQAFGFHVQKADGFMSRAFETSSDRYAGSRLPNEVVAGTFLKLMGADFGLQDRKALIAEMTRQADAALSQLKPGELNSIEDASHPSPLLRFSWIMNIEKDPTLIFANRFYRLLALLSETAEQEVLLLDAQKTLKEPEQLAEIEFSLKKVGQLKVSMIARIAKLIMQQDYAAAHTPRLRNFVEYLLYSKEKLSVASEIARKMNIPIDAGIARIKILEDLGTLLKADLEMQAQKAKGEQGTRVKSNLETLKLALALQDFEQIQKLRATMMTELKGRKASRQLPLLERPKFEPPGGGGSNPDGGPADPAPKAIKANRCQALFLASLGA